MNKLETLHLDAIAQADFDPADKSPTMLGLHPNQQKQQKGSLSSLPNGAQKMPSSTTTTTGFPISETARPKIYFKNS